MRFVKPRMRITEFARYGLRNDTKLVIKDESEIIAFADEHDLPLYKTTKKVNNKDVMNAIGEGHDIPGCKILSGDVPKYTINKAILNAEIKKRI